MQIEFLNRVIVTPISDCAPALGVSFINLYPVHIGFKVIENDKSKNWRIAIPPFIISDGMSVPDTFDGAIPQDEGIRAGHIHDCLFALIMANEMKELSEILDMSGFDIANEVLREYLKQYCPGFNFIEIAATDLAVSVFGSRSYQDPKRDKWRMEVAHRLMPNLPGRGLGAREITEEDRYKVEMKLAEFNAPADYQFIGG